MTQSPRQPRAQTGPVQYRGSDLEAERGPGLGCFRFQVVVLVIFIVLTPISVSLNWPVEISSALLILTIVLLLFVGQTVIFLLRLVAAERRGRRRPLASGTPTVGELEERQRSARSAEPTEEPNAEPTEKSNAEPTDTAKPEAPTTSI